MRSHNSRLAGAVKEHRGREDPLTYRKRKLPLCYKVQNYAVVSLGNPTWKCALRLHAVYTTSASSRSCCHWITGARSRAIRKGTTSSHTLANNTSASPVSRSTGCSLCSMRGQSNYHCSSNRLFLFLTLCSRLFRAGSYPASPSNSTVPHFAAGLGRLAPDNSSLCAMTPE